MYIEDLTNYVDERINKGLTKCTITTENDGAGHLYVTKTKEEYVVLDEDEGDDLINEARQDRHYLASKKTYKAGKVNKNGEIKSPECWKIVIELSH